MPKCKNKDCREPFEKFRPNQVVCSVKCAYEYNRQLQEKKKKKSWKERKAKLKEGLKTRSDYMKEAQTVFNAYIRERDKKLPCISCGKYHKGQNHAGHYRSVGNSPELRFEELNVWLQCSPCNTHLHGNLIEYRKNLIDRIGLHKVEWLEGSHKPLKLTIPELILLKEEYKEKLRKLKG